MENREEGTKTPNIRILIRNFLIELVLYGVLVVGYFLVALRLKNNYLTGLFHSNLVLYAILALFLIVVQGVLLDGVTSFLLNQVKLERLD